MKKIFNIVSELKECFAAGVPREIAEQAIDQNGWFSFDEIALALRAISQEMLEGESFAAWLSRYTTATKRERVLIVMAGNIPLVGFADLLCTIAAGHCAIVKPSHKDRTLTEWVISMLREIEPDIPIYIYNEGDHADRIIATGGDAAVSYFRAKYHNIPMLLRGSRHSVAVIDGNFEGLEEDIFSYSGLGCRNVSLLFVPQDFDLSQLPTSCVNPKQRNSYLRQRALHTMNRRIFFDSGTHCIVEQNDFPREVGELSIIRYSNAEEPREWIALHDEELQCVVAHDATLSHPRRADFGRAQHPTLWDYADGVDTMKFLLK